MRSKGALGADQDMAAEEEDDVKAAATQKRESPVRSVNSQASARLGGGNQRCGWAHRGGLAFKPRELDDIGHGASYEDADSVLRQILSVKQKISAV